MTEGNAVVSPGAVAGTAIGAAAAPNRTRLMLTDDERLVFMRCSESGDTPEECLKFDDDIIEQVMSAFEKKIRLDRIRDRLERDPSWLRQQIAKLRAGVRERTDEPTADRINKALAESAAVDAASEDHNAPEGDA